MVYSFVSFLSYHFRPEALVDKSENMLCVLTSLVQFEALPKTMTLLWRGLVWLFGKLGVVAEIKRTPPTNYAYALVSVPRCNYESVKFRRQTKIRPLFTGQCCTTSTFDRLALRLASFKFCAYKIRARRHCCLFN